MLDEEWVDSRIRYRLIRALIDVVKRFGNVRHVKIVLAIRQDLFEKVLYSIKETGFQEDKFDSIQLRLKWSKSQLIELVEKRISTLFTRKYSNSSVTLSDVMPESVDGQPPMDYMLDRTFLRPRDIIDFFNRCLVQAEGETRLTAAIIKSAEHDYSHGRLHAIITEWGSVHPNIEKALTLLEGVDAKFEISAWSQSDIETRLSDFFDENTAAADPITIQLAKLYEPTSNFSSIRSFVLREFYKLGVVGVKPNAGSPTLWVAGSRASLSAGDLTGKSTIFVHPMFNRALSINTKN